MNKRICRSLFTVFLCLLFVLAAPAAAAAQTSQFYTEPASAASSFRSATPVRGVYTKSGHLVKKGNRIRYKRSNGKYLRSSWKTIHGKTYYFMKNTFAVKGFQQIGGKVYYFDRSGVLQKKSQYVSGKKLRVYKSGVVHSYGGKRYNTAKSKGQQVVAYACRFIGTPYKWGGSSLTKGVDCSGFVMAVYAHFGVYLPHYDASIRKCGREVSSLSKARPGDVICYRGHVAIYMGNNRIVHSTSSHPESASAITHSIHGFSLSGGSSDPFQGVPAILFNDE